MIELIRGMASELPGSVRPKWLARAEELAAFAELLKRWSAVHNLTTVRDDQGIARRHLMDSAVGLSLTPQPMERVLDVGSGGGLPGVVWALLSDAQVTCVDKVRKKASFLRTVKRELGLDSLHVECADAFTLTGDWDLVTSRATISGSGVARFRDLAPSVALFLGPSADVPELEGALSPWELEIKSYTLPGLGERMMGFSRNPDAG